MPINVEYYKKFPIVLRSALLKGEVAFPDSLNKEYDSLIVYRGVRYNSIKTEITKDDFCSNVEQMLKNPVIVADTEDISSYSCSCYLEVDAIRLYAKFPRKNKAIAKGVITKEFGPIDINNDTSHIDLYLFDNVDPSNNFEVVERWRKNG